MMLDLQAISDELTKAFILKEYSERIPVFKIANFEEEAMELYRNDNTFNHRVRKTIAVILQIIEKHNK